MEYIILYVINFIFLCCLTSIILNKSEKFWLTVILLLLNDACISFTFVLSQYIKNYVL